jgi:nucleoside-diphosphate-sugar epimerase
MISLKDRRIVLIGGAGFIGHNLALELTKLGANVFIIDGLRVNNLTYFASTNKKIVNRELYLKIIENRLDLIGEANIPLYDEDARDYARLSLALTEIKPNVVVHLAAVAHADRSNKDPYSTFDHSLRT